MPYGYKGKVLHVNLSNSSIEIEKPSERFYREYMGGSALALYYILNNMPAKVDALDERNILVIAVSPLTGAPISGQSRVTAMAKSPLTSCIGDSQGGGYFPAQMKFSGFDAVVIKGKALNPVYLWLNKEKAELRDASQLWGKITSEVEDAIRDELHDAKIEVLQCGIAGENGVRFANLINNSNRANGRTGMGAVMASKNLKAIAARGSGPLVMADAEAVKTMARCGVTGLKDSPAYFLSQFGTAGGINWQNNSGGLATRNWSSGTFEGAEKLDGVIINRDILIRRDSCFACAVRCKPVVEVNEGSFLVNPRYGGPEFETLCTFGSYCGVSNLSAIAKANQLCNMYGMDTITCGATIAWAMDCFEKGIITKKDTQGIELRFGNAEAMVSLVEMIAHCKGFGNILSEGSARASKHFGKTAEGLVVSAKGQEFPAHMPQLKRSLALIYAVSPSGADHQSSEHDPSYSSSSERMAQLGLNDPQPESVLNDEKVRFAFITECLYSAMDTLDVCQFVFGAGWQLYDTLELVNLVNAVTGWNFSIEELLRLGERKINMMRIFNLREGIDSRQDKLPNKLKLKLTGGPTDGVFVDEQEFEEAKRIYYKRAGWDEETGIPRIETLDRMGLSWLTNLLSQPEQH
jgi:aldehyde:ferredoxin oxidoreductase